MSTAAAEEEYGGGIGGKPRRRQSRRSQATPYDRPAAAAAARLLRGNNADAAAEEAGRTSRWISRLVDPASTLITKGATRLLSSVFRKRPGAFPAPESPVASFEPRQAIPDVSNNSPLPEIQEQRSKIKDDSKNHSNVDVISELEQRLKQKTFTKAEFDRLKDLLHSRTVDSPKEDENKRIEGSNLLTVGDYKKQENEILASQENRTESSKFAGIISTPGPTLKIREEEHASPAEVAKAYMGSRSSKVSPSSLSLRSQMVREAAGSPSFIGCVPKSSAAPIFSKSVVHFSGVPGSIEDGYMTPRLRGRSAIYKMSRSPYLRGQPTVMLKDSSHIEGGHLGSSMSIQWTPMNGALSSGKQVLKRRSSVLENDLGFVGPTRRIRQKSNLASTSEDIISQSPGRFLPTTNSLDIVQGSSSSTKRPCPLLEHKYDTSNMKKRENQEERSGYPYVPLQSREMAEKILQQLDKLVPSPKGQSIEAKTSLRDELPSKLTLDTLHGEASKSLVTEIDATKLFNVEANGKLQGSSIFRAGSHRSSMSPVNGVAENGPSKLIFSDTKMASEGVGSLATSTAETMPVEGSVDSVFLHSTVSPSQKMPAFKMQAPEGSLEQEDDSYSRRGISGPRASEKKIEIIDQKSAIFETALVKKTFAFSSDNMSGSNIQLTREAEKIVSDGPALSNKDSGFTFQASLPLSTPCQATPTSTMSSPPIDEPVPSSGQNGVPLFTFGSKSTPLIFLSGMNSTYLAGQNSGTTSDFKVRSSESSSTTIPTSIAPVERTESGDVEETQKTGVFHKPVGNASSYSLSMPCTSSSFQFVASATSSLSNGSLATNSSIFSVSSASAASLSGSLASAIVSAGPVTVSSSSNGPSSSPTFSAFPSTRFGMSPSAVFTDADSSVVKSISTGLEPKLIKESPPCSSVFSSSGSSIFGFSALASSGATFCGSVGLVLGSQAAQSGSGTSIADGTKSQFSSAASPTFGLAGSCGFSGSASGSLITSVNPFASSSLLLSPVAACASPPSDSSLTPTVTAPNVFGSSSQSSISSMLGCNFGSSASPSVSTFAISSATSVTASFSSSSMSPFSVASSVATTSSVFSFTQATQATNTSSSAFSFTLGATTTSAPLSPLISVSPGNDQMNVEDSMADYMVQAPSPVVPTFGQSSNVPAPSLPFGLSPTLSRAPAFQFASSQPSAFPPSQTLCQATGSFEFGGNFSMGSGGGDKSGRKFIKAKRDKHRKR